jgi:predicted nucleic acid-binding protein
MAAQALSLTMTIVTRDQAFKKLPDLVLEEWIL